MKSTQVSEPATSDLMILALPISSFKKLHALSSVNDKTVAQLLTEAIDAYIGNLKKE
jgi:predicted DNA-binding protein